MKKSNFKPRFAITVVAMTCLGAMAGQAYAEPVEDRVRDNWIFVFDDTVPAKDVQNQADRAVAGVGGQRGHVYSHAIRGFSARMPAQAAANLKARNPHIRYYEADQIARAIGKPSKVDPTVKPLIEGEVPWGIARVHGPVEGAAGTAWVIDTGVDQNHPDLNVDTGRSQNFVSDETKVDDGNGHGTHVAGTIAAIKNGTGVVGVAAGARVVGIRVLDDTGSGSYDDVIAGVDHVAGQGQLGDVANMSLSGPLSTALNDAVRNASANVKFALAAGNDRQNAKNFSPASAEGANIYTVVAFDINDAWASFSNYGQPPVDCADPGVDVISTYKDGLYATMSGTSMATPHVAGLLLLSLVKDGQIKRTRTDYYPVCVYRQSGL
ncbi:MAG: S8 family serine peptidase [Thiobacillus sp.]|nr:S8 family serine peptidase [Thiobacillus sp.]